jgi:hypothetical protein
MVITHRASEVLFTFLQLAPIAMLFLRSHLLEHLLTTPTPASNFADANTIRRASSINGPSTKEIH